MLRAQIRVNAVDSNARRYVISFAAELKTIGGQPWVKMVVVGQSFMLHQIRKMVSGRAATWSDCVQRTHGAERRDGSGSCVLHAHAHAQGCACIHGCSLQHVTQLPAGRTGACTHAGVACQRGATKPGTAWAACAANACCRPAARWAWQWR